MAGPDRIEGYAIVSADGMIADAGGVQPETLKPEADQRLFYAALERADAVAHGRNSAEAGPEAAGRRRLILTRSIAGVARHPENPHAALWNPAGATLDQAWAMLGLDGGLLAVIGGTGPFGLFLQRGYDAFHLTTAGTVRLPGGRPVFPGIPPGSPEDALAAGGLKPDPAQALEPSQALSLTVWRR